MSILDDEKFRKTVEQDLKINVGNIDGELLVNVDRTQNYVSLWFRKVAELKEAIREKDKKYAELYNHYKYEFDKVLDTTKEVEIFIRGDEAYQIVCKKVDELSTEVDFLQKTHENMVSKGFNIRDYMKWQMYLKGDRD